MRKKIHCGAHVLVAIFLALALAHPTWAEPVVPGEEHCVVRVRHDDLLYMREKPSARSAIVARKRHNECGIRVNGRCRGNWCPVEDGHSLGWAHRRYLAMVSPSLYCVAGVLPGDALNLRAFPSQQSRVIVRLSHRQCDIAFLPYTIGSWQKVRVRLGYEGWVKRRSLSGE